MSAARPGRRFQPGNPGKKKGAKDRRTVVGIEVCKAMSGDAVDRLRELIHSRSPRVSIEAVKLVLGYSWGLPRATLELAGGFGNLASELSAALAAVRASRQAALPAPVVEAVLVEPDAPAAPSIAAAPTSSTPEPEAA